MAVTSAPGTIRRISSGDGPNRTGPPPSQRSITPGDRISDLPLHLKDLIFRSLPFEDVVKTSVLSKSWRSTWANTTHLAFVEKMGERLREDSLDFACFVDSILTRFISPTVKSFRVTNLRYNDVVRSELDSCLRFVKERHVEEIRLLFWATISYAPILYALPTSLYCVSSLVSLKVRSCRFSLDGTISWPRLKDLSVQNVELSEDVLKGIFMGSPLLESLKLSDCRGL